MNSIKRLSMALLAAGCAVALVVAARAAPKLVAGHVCGGGGSSSGGKTVVGSVPASAAGRSAGGNKVLIGGFAGCVYAVRESASAADAVAAASGTLVSSLNAVGTKNGGAQVTFSLSSAATVDVRVLNIAGRQIRAVTRARECEAGLNTIAWSGMSDVGLRVPRGLYLIELTSHVEEGARCRALASVKIGN
jgi:hypothetical protein